MDLPLSGIRVLDCTRLLPFEYGTQLLADLGAQVIKVEAPGGEYGRMMRHDFAQQNRHKQSVTLNLWKAEGQELFRKLTTQAHVVFESFRPGTMAKCGLDYESLRSIRPSLVYCSTTGYGQTGPYRMRPGHDLNYLSLSAVVQPFSGRPPVLPPLPVADMLGGLFSAYCIVSAVFLAYRTGVGQYIDLSMSDVMLSINAHSVAMDDLRNGLPDASGGAMLTEKLQSREDPFGVPGLDTMLTGEEWPCYGVYRTADGRYLSLGCSEPKFWRNFVTVLGRPDLAPDRAATGDRGAAVRQEVQKLVAARTLAKWLECLEGKDVCYAPVLTAQAIDTDPHVLARGMVDRHPSGARSIAFPAKFSATPARRGGTVPAPGQDNAAIFGELGYEPETLARWADAGII